ncbi:hypothetical protein BJ508DRAFT_326723 [Ascobolus immersus RN42]|uniref:Sister chromatid cohesion protein Dcc1 n=1 Tax=Ascobolus immersus RN42 TaxID=1160509 RepID=A0A3N4I4U8_ASCIM|nr:hypothetical protein BJ508DRAFT_326723 [Ascobolus immersus RN42]
MTQPNAYTVPIAYSTIQTPIRLIELPPALLDLVTSPNPPTLHLKSLPPVPHPTTANPQPHAYLTTPTQTFTIRQVSSSNNTFLLRHADHTRVTTHYPPSIDPLNPPEPEIREETALTSILTSTTTSHLEVLPYSPNPVATLRKMVPAYSDLYTPAPLYGSKETLFLDVPLSRLQFEQGWKEALCFEDTIQVVDEDGDSTTRTCIWRLDPLLTLRVLKMLEEFRLSEGLSWSLEPRVIEDFREMFSEDGSAATRWMPGMVETIIRNVMEGNVHRFTARMALEILSEHGAISVDKLKKGWLDYLPETMRAGAEAWTDEKLVELVKGYSESPTARSVKFVEPPELLVVEGGAAKGAVKKGKWHEKFAAQRK